MEPMFKHQSSGFSTSSIDRTINHVKVKWITVAWNYSFNNVYVVSAYHLQNERGKKPLILEMGMWSPINLTAIYHSKVTDSITMPFLVSKQNYIITHVKVVGFKRIYISIVNLSTAFHYKKDMIYSPSSSFYLIYENTSCVLKTIILCKSCQHLRHSGNSTNRLN